MSEKKIILILIGLAVIVFIGYAGTTYYLSFKKQTIEQIPKPTTSLAEEKEKYKNQLETKFTGEKFPGEYYNDARLQHYLGKIKNNGGKSINNISLRLEYLNAGGRPISEGRIDINKILKSGFIAEFQYGGIEVPAEWSGQARSAIIDFNFVE